LGALILVTLEEVFAVFVVLLIAFLLVLALGVLYGVVLRRASREGTAWRIVAQTGFVAGIMAAVLTALAALMSFTSMLEATPLNGPLGLAAFLGIPAALVGIGCGAVGLRSDARSQALVGLVLSAACVVAWTVMETVAG
jgi:hypothetical protein